MPDLWYGHEAFSQSIIEHIPNRRSTGSSILVYILYKLHGPRVHLSVGDVWNGQQANQGNHKGVILLWKYITEFWDDTVLQ